MCKVAVALNVSNNQWRRRDWRLPKTTVALALGLQRKLFLWHAMTGAASTARRRALPSAPASLKYHQRNKVSCSLGGLPR